MHQNSKEKPFCFLVSVMWSYFMYNLVLLFKLLCGDVFNNKYKQTNTHTHCFLLLFNIFTHSHSKKDIIVIKKKRVIQSWLRAVVNIFLKGNDEKKTLWQLT